MTIIMTDVARMLAHVFIVTGMISLITAHPG